ncbi:unnamed protein product [Heligmosomoides polygyrus]|uniref:RanBD1 domain-containing protein n=1 Tax=Heligmosomoides polygyrus TaxID=6339 RepID=A0A183FT55_HELPZ|nr:unnamed protein product [Heligmosomoides polygyrus]
MRFVDRSRAMMTCDPVIGRLQRMGSALQPRTHQESLLLPRPRAVEYLPAVSIPRPTLALGLPPTKLRDHKAHPGHYIGAEHLKLGDRFVPGNLESESDCSFQPDSFAERDTMSDDMEREIDRIVEEDEQELCRIGESAAGAGTAETASAYHDPTEYAADDANWNGKSTDGGYMATQRPILDDRSGPHNPWFQSNVSSNEPQYTTVRRPTPGENLPRDIAESDTARPTCGLRSSTQVKVPGVHICQPNGITREAEASKDEELGLQILQTAGKPNERNCVKKEKEGYSNKLALFRLAKDTNPLIWERNVSILPLDILVAASKSEFDIDADVEEVKVDKNTNKYDASGRMMFFKGAVRLASLGLKGKPPRQDWNRGVSNHKAKAEDETKRTQSGEVVIESTKEAEWLQELRDDTTCGQAIDALERGDLAEEEPQLDRQPTSADIPATPKQSTRRHGTDPYDVKDVNIKRIE